MKTNFCVHFEWPLKTGFTVGILFMLCLILQAMKGQRIQGFILLVCLWYTRASSVPDYCSYIESDGYFECDYSKMSDPAYRPIDFSQFDPAPQRLKLNVNGYLPYYSK